MKSRYLLVLTYNAMFGVVFHLKLISSCSAGVGRTGTIILCDICLRMAAKENFIDVLNNFYNLREQRPNMVDNPEQYKLVHLVILECLFAPKTSYECDKTLEKRIYKLLENGGVEKQLEYLEETAWYDLVMKSTVCSEENYINYPEKNRFQDIIPGRIITEVKNRPFWN